MTLVTGTDGRAVQLGLAASPYALDVDVTGVLGRSWRETVNDHLITILQSIIPSDFDLRFASAYPAMDTEEAWGSLDLPILIVTTFGSTSRSVGVGDLLWVQRDGKKYFGFNQEALLILDLWADDRKECDQILGHVQTWICGVGKRTTLLERGFQDIWLAYTSRNELGFDYWRYYVYRPNMLTVPVFRAVDTYQTMFDVAFRLDDPALGQITAIQIGSTDEYEVTIDLGHSMGYFYFEDTLLSWFDIGV